MARLLPDHRRLARIAVASTVWLAAFLCAAGGRVQAQQQGQLFMSVLDATGYPLANLAVGDVTVQVDDVACKVINVEPFKKPMKLTVMIDNGSAVSNALSNLRTAVKNLIDALPEGLQIELLTTAPQPRWLEKFTADHAILLKAVDRLAPDSGAGLFFDALSEAGNRADKDKGEYFPVFLMVASDVGRNSGAMDRDYQKLQKQVIDRAITVHFVMFNSGGERVGGVAGAVQTEVGLALTKMSGGRYENISAHTRLVTLLPELGKQITESNLRQSQQFRITYERPGKNLKPAQRISAGVTRGGTPMLSLDGHLP